MLLREMQSGDGDGDLLMERLETVDALQCLGIDLYFDAEIKLFLDSAFRSHLMTSHFLKFAYL